MTIESSESVYLLSVYPEDLISPTFVHEGQPKVYRIPKAELDDPNSYSVLEVKPTWVYTLNYANQDAHEMVRRPISARALAEDLIRIWSDCGVTIINGPVPTKDELKHARTIFSNLLRRKVEEANSFWVSNNPEERKRIGNSHRKALEWLHEDTKAFPWYIQMHNQPPKACHACRRMINRECIVCPECGHDLAEFCLRYGIHPTGDEVVLKAMEMLTKPQKKT